MKKNNLFLLGFIASFFISCINEEGVGGSSIVEGKVFKVMHYNDIYSFDADTFPAAKEDVYIVYGDEPIYGDKMETGNDGFFRFKYLTKGTYHVFAYSILPNGRKQAVIDTVTVGTGKTARTANIYIHEGKSYETSYIKGSVLVKYYNKGFITALMPANDVRVCIRTKGALYHFDEIRTSSDGIFMFQGLAPGEYEVFVLTEQAGDQVLTPIIKSVTIQKKGEIVVMPTPFEIIINA